MSEGKRDGSAGTEAKVTQAEFGGAKGAIQTLNNIVNLTVVSKNANDLAAEYAAGVVQGQLQGRTIVSTRDNTWDNAYLTDPDLGYGVTPYPKTIPDGSVDAKVASTEMVRSFMKLSGELDVSSKQTSFWMLYGTPVIKGQPFVWSESAWRDQKRRDVPDRVEGRFTLMPILMR